MYPQPTAAPSSDYLGFNLYRNVGDIQTFVLYSQVSRWCTVLRVCGVELYRMLQIYIEFEDVVHNRTWYEMVWYRRYADVVCSRCRRRGNDRRQHAATSENIAHFALSGAH